MLTPHFDHVFFFFYFVFIPKGSVRLPAAAARVDGRERWIPAAPADARDPVLHRREAARQAEGQAGAQVSRPNRRHPAGDARIDADHLHPDDGRAAQPEADQLAWLGR